ncbi:hypothetical protein O6H91_21G073000 [Diphasiastrum complanatum]|uniref:Uncharacterized protein n=3 Tax=Diphasiastrum complanatum TaxID=34168 RepID=A0ACC2ALS7_DIPCM|nr:hypothetical protein O6H91_21G073000 [Diphasiastrum complanatum]KAJ7518532.1 hypothetical protein O6H91_21G073000 [Diphasiastrum complanatum]KAJ7518533.1 hypothetical protein O6H91_21G073000 [Diphasiastrum complanatum]
MRPRTPVKNRRSGVVADEEKVKADKAGRAGLATRKKGAGVRAWLLVDAYGGAQVVEAGKHTIMRRTYLPARDLRILDPLLSYPSTILGREHAIVVNLEHIKAIITAQEVLLLNSKDPLVAPFVADLQRRLPMHYNALGQQVVTDGGSDNDGVVNRNGRGYSPVIGKVSNNVFPQDMRQRQQQALSLTNESEAHSHLQFPDTVVKSETTSSNRGGPNILPFEFRALEACLEAACSCLDTEATALEQQAYPALDELTSKISTLNLERVRQIKSRLVAISGRVQKVRDEIEQLLDDDEDMAEMYLTAKSMRQQLEGNMSLSSNHIQDHLNMTDTDTMESDEEDERTIEDGAAISHRIRSEHHNKSNNATNQEEVVGSFSGIRKGDANSRSHSSNSTVSHHGKQLDIEELEMLLEAYFVQIDGTLNKLSTLKEYVDDTEDYINIMLDDKQNHLLQMGVMLTTATLVISAFIVVTGIMGMNIRIPLFDNGTFTQFLWVVGGSGTGALLTYITIIGWCRWKRLIE